MVAGMLGVAKLRATVVIFVESPLKGLNLEITNPVETRCDTSLHTNSLPFVGGYNGLVYHSGAQRW